MQKRANNLSGYFSVREYNAKKERKDWNIKAEGLRLNSNKFSPPKTYPLTFRSSPKSLKRKTAQRLAQFVSKSVHAASGLARMGRASS